MPMISWAAEIGLWFTKFKRGHESGWVGVGQMWGSIERGERESEYDENSWYACVKFSVN